MGSIKSPKAEIYYGYHVGVWRVDADGDLDESIIDLRSVEEPTFDQAIASDDYERLQNLAFVRFYAKACIRVRHDGLTRPETEFLVGDLKEVFEEQFVVDKVGSSPILMPKSEIILSGQLSPYLAEWLGRVADHGAPYHWSAIRTLEDFETLLGKPLTPNAPLVTHDL